MREGVRWSRKMQEAFQLDEFGEILESLTCVGDGRAVLRSSIREFLASEAMHHLGDTDMARWLSSTHHTEIYPVHLYHSRSHGALRLVQLKQDWICMLQLFLVCGGVETTRALSLVVSGSETVRRPWYADNGPAGLG